MLCFFVRIQRSHWHQLSYPKQLISSDKLPLDVNAQDLGLGVELRRRGNMRHEITRPQIFYEFIVARLLISLYLHNYGMRVMHSRKRPCSQASSTEFRIRLPVDNLLHSSILRSVPGLLAPCQTSFAPHFSLLAENGGRKDLLLLCVYYTLF